MKKINIVKSNRDFNNIIKKNKAFKFKYYIIYVEKKDSSVYKFGFSVGKKIGNAVTRNKYKRKLRAIIDKCKKNYINSKDYIIILRKGALDKNFQELQEDYINLI